MLRSKPMVPGGRPPIALGYKYNARKVLYFIVTDNRGRTLAGLTCLYMYSDKFSYVSIIPVSCPLFMHKLFGFVNEVGSHKKPRQFDLGQEKFWFTQCVLTRLYATVAMGITITNIQK